MVDRLFAYPLRHTTQKTGIHPAHEQNSTSLMCCYYYYSSSTTPASTSFATPELLASP